MRKWVSSLWENYKYRFVPWIVLNLKQTKKETTTKINKGKAIKTSEGTKVDTSDKLLSGSSPMIVDHVTKGHDKLVSDQIIRDLLVKFFERLSECHEGKSGEHDYLSKKGQEIMHQVFGYSVERRKSQVCEGTGVFLTSGQAKSGDLIGKSNNFKAYYLVYQIICFNYYAFYAALYPGTLYLPSEPLFFPSLGNPFIFRCSDNLHIDGNDRLLSKSVYKSCSARDKFQVDLPCCDLTWLTSQPLNPINIGQYVNNRSKSQENNVVYQESEITLGGKGPSNFPVHLCRYLPNVWGNPENNRYPLRLVPLIAVKQINEGDEILSSYFTFVHVQSEKVDNK